MVENFKFYVPAECGLINKSYYLQGIASTGSKDADGEYLDPTGFDLSYLNSVGQANWQHQSKDPNAIVGSPEFARVYKKGEVMPNNKLAPQDLLWLSVKMYDGQPMAADIVKLAEAMRKSGSDRQLAFSIEGQVIERDPLNPKRVPRSKITNVAITPTPKNTDSFAELIEKGFVNTADLQNDNSISDCVLDVTDPETGERIIVDKDYKIKVIKPTENKAIDVANVAPMTKESMNNKIVDLTKTAIKKGSESDILINNEIEMTETALEALSKAKLLIEQEDDILKAKKACDTNKEEKSDNSKDEDEDGMDKEPDEDEDDNKMKDGKEPAMFKLKKSYTLADLNCSNESEAEAVIAEAINISKLVKSVTSEGIVYTQVTEPIEKSIVENDIKKAINAQNASVLNVIEQMAHSLDELVKGFNSKTEALESQNKELTEKLTKAEKAPIRKSFASNATVVERFQKGIDSPIVLSEREDKKRILNVLETLGIDSDTKQHKDTDLVKSMVDFELGAPLSQYAKNRLSDKNIVIE